jgi:hypothetical protein
MIASILAKGTERAVSIGMRRLTAPAVTVMSLALAAPVAAADRRDLTGERILADFARCAVRGAPDDARALLGTVPGDAAERQLIGKFARKRLRCLNMGRRHGPVRFRFDGQAMRGAIAERLYLDLNRTFRPVAAAVTFDDVAGPTGYAVVRCAVARSPDAADALVRAARLSPEETAAGAALAPALNACARGMGRLDISGTALHGWAAEALYKLRSSNASKVL